MNLNETRLDEIKNLKVQGRTSDSKAPLTLFWTGSTLEFNAKGSEFWIEIEAGFNFLEPWFRVDINGVQVSRQMAYRGRQWICLFRGMNPDIVKNVIFTRETQAMSDDPECMLAIWNVRFDGEFMPVEEKPYKFEFIGDSITSGEGIIGAKEEQDWIPMFFGTGENYAIATAKAFDADYRILSQSGWGTLTSWDNNPYCSMPAYYEQVCGLLSGDRNEKSGAKQLNDFSAWQPDVVVVNLGTNDAAAFDQAEWIDEKTGESFKQHKNEDGTYNIEDIKRLQTAIIAFLCKIRKYNSKAYIFWCNGMLGTPIFQEIQEAVLTYQLQTGDEKITLIQLPECNDATMGARSHPGPLSHGQAAEILIKEISKIAGIPWKKS